MNKIALALLLGAIVLVSGCIAPPPPNVKITTCQLSNNQISQSQSTSLFIVINNYDSKFYQNSSLIIDRNPKLSILDSGAQLGNSIGIPLQPGVQVSKAFDVKGIIETGISQSIYSIIVRENIEGKDVSSCKLDIVITQ